jgi:CrcB protein
MSAFVAIGFGAALGAWLRWGLGLWLNPKLLGGYLIGVAIAYFAQHPGLPPEWRLFAITGFLGALTTFSTFSAEIFTLVSRGQLAWALGAASAHLFGSLICTALGVWSYSQLRG